MPQNTEFLSEGDVVEIKEGMQLYASIPERFVFANRSYSPASSLARTKIVVGEVRELEIPGKPKLIFDTSIFAGTYLVTRTVLDGGAPEGRVPYSDGHHVTVHPMGSDAQPLDSKPLDFYQSGSFSAIILPSQIAPCAKMKKIVTWAKTSLLKTKIPSTPQASAPKSESKLTTRAPK